MARTKSLSDEQVLTVAHLLMHEAGPEALTFDALSRACGLSPATLVQRFKTKAGLKRATLSQAWDALDEKTAALAPDVAKRGVEKLPSYIMACQIREIYVFSIDQVVLVVRFPKLQ